MAYTKTPCNAGDATAAVGTSGPTAYGSGNSSSMTKAQMKQRPMLCPARLRADAEPGRRRRAVECLHDGHHMMATQSCGPAKAVAITDEYGRKYNCRGDRIR